MTRLRRTFTILCCVFTFFDGASAGAVDCPEVGKGRVAKALGASSLIGIFSIELASCDELVLNSDSVGFRLQENTMPVHGGIRSEVAVNFPFQEGDVVKYEWEMKFPVDFVLKEPEKKWWLIAQWHDQPNRRLGETWQTFPSKSPPVALYLEERDGEAGLGVIVNGGKDKLSWAKLPVDQWLKVSVTLRWAADDSGWIVFDVSGHPEFSMRRGAKTMNNNYQHYLKFGQYRNPKIKSDTIVFFRNLNISKLNVLPN